MGSGVDIPWVGWGRYAMDRVSKYHGQGGQYTMGRGSIYHGYEARYTKCRKLDIPWVGSSTYHG